MKHMLILLVLVFIVSGLTGIDMSLAPGLSVKNLFLYVPAGLLLLRALLVGGVQVEDRRVPVALLVLFLYAALMTVVPVVLLDYRQYSLIDSVMRLKNGLFDYLMIFVVFLYCLNGDEAKRVLTFLLACFGISHLLGIAHYFDYIDLAGLTDPHGDVTVGRRLSGFVGENNQYGTLIACCIAPTVVKILSARSTGERVFWVFVLLMSGVALLLTGSRGAVLGLLAGGVALVGFYHRVLPMSRIIGGAALGGVAALAVVGVVVLTTGDFLYDRFVASSRMSGDVSSGRFEVWMSILRLMADHPAAIITGFGWNSYVSVFYGQPSFSMLPHNNYLQFWFDLGLIGVAAFVSALWICVATLRRAASSARGEERDMLIAISVGVVAGAVAVFFVDAQSFWPYFWMLAALGCRIAFSVSPRAPALEARPLEQRSQAVGITKFRDSYGWRQ